MTRQVKLKGLKIATKKTTPTLILTITKDRKTLTLERDLTNGFFLHKTIELLKELNTDKDITFTSYKDLNKIVKNTKIKRTCMILFKDIEREYFNKYERPYMTDQVKKRIEERIKKAEEMAKG